MRDFFCDTFGWWCADYGEHVTHAVPEISPDGLLGAVVLVVGLLAVKGGKK